VNLKELELDSIYYYNLSDVWNRSVPGIRIFKTSKTYPLMFSQLCAGSNLTNNYSEINELDSIFFGDIIKFFKPVNEKIKLMLIK
jgi:hypothetical protein